MDSSSRGKKGATRCDWFYWFDLGSGIDHHLVGVGLLYTTRIISLGRVYSAAGVFLRMSLSFCSPGFPRSPSSAAEQQEDDWLCLFRGIEHEKPLDQNFHPYIDSSESILRKKKKRKRRKDVVVVVLGSSSAEEGRKGRKEGKNSKGIFSSQAKTCTIEWKCWSVLGKVSGI